MKRSPPLARPKLLLVVTEDWYFVSHRLPLALGAIAAGMDVAIATNVSSHGDLISRAGIEVHPWNLRRGSTGLWAEFKSLLGLWRIYRRVRPDIVHQVAIKPVLYGGLAAKLTGTTRVVNALGGMGSLFSTESGRKRALRALVSMGFRWLINGRSNVLILQNPDDAALLVEGARIDPANIRLIRGAGVNVRQFDVSAEPDGVPLVVLPARMLADKGVREFVEAARILKSAGLAVRMALVGEPDACNPDSIAADSLRAWADSGDVEWWGRREDMPAVYAAASLVCLPSYREGLPKSLLEAAACGRAIVATDVPGCREIVRHGENGMLVPARDAKALAAAIAILVNDPQLRRSMGSKGREMVLQEFSEESVVRETLDIYRALLPGSTLALGARSTAAI
ncbi:glycosyltransferase family 4 protein [Massilia glaciei]|uniref:Glycosyltransferase family 1 protein n=1 Tax=Massilia glaciei TaxID=1524097 RepID=A0A2U2HN13_9BURK|nr:glycosyltransferase family 4 protein [Massilia glaciei]PWF48898.1 glycosyltransferase family 1 protein [Massilia glaciei]